MTGYDEALAWFRADPERMQDLDEVDNRSAVIAIVRALLAAPPTVPAGRDLTAQDVIDVMQAWRTGRVNVAVATDELNRIARPSGGVGRLEGRRAMTADDTARTDGPDTHRALVDAITEIRQSPGGQRHWSTEFDEDGEPYGELCWCSETGGEDH